jgi:hypothetical protein
MIIPATTPVARGGEQTRGIAYLRIQTGNFSGTSREQDTPEYDPDNNLAGGDTNCGNSDGADTNNLNCTNPDRDSNRSNPAEDKGAAAGSAPAASGWTSPATTRTAPTPEFPPSA